MEKGGGGRSVGRPNINIKNDESRTVRPGVIHQTINSKPTSLGWGGRKCSWQEASRDVPSSRWGPDAKNREGQNVLVFDLGGGEGKGSMAQGTRMERQMVLGEKRGGVRGRPGEFSL